MQRENEPASLVLGTVAGATYTLCPDNGGSSGTGYSKVFRLATLRSIWRRGAGRFSPFPALCTAGTAPTRPLHSLLLLSCANYRQSLDFVKAQIHHCQPNLKSEPSKLQK
jgi:hypothetical protein